MQNAVKYWSTEDTSITKSAQTVDVLIQSEVICW